MLVLRLLHCKLSVTVVTLLVVLCLPYTACAQRTRRPIGAALSLLYIVLVKAGRYNIDIAIRPRQVVLRFLVWAFPYSAGGRAVLLIMPLFIIQI